MTTNLDALLSEAAADVRTWADARPLPPLDGLPSGSAHSPEVRSSRRRPLVAAAALLAVVGGLSWWRSDRSATVVVPGDTSTAVASRGGTTGAISTPIGRLADGTPWHLSVDPWEVVAPSSGLALRQPVLHLGNTAVPLVETLGVDPFLAGTGPNVNRVADVVVHGSRVVILALPEAWTRFTVVRALGPSGGLSSTAFQLIVPPLPSVGDAGSGRVGDRPFVAIAVDADDPWTTIELTDGPNPGGHHVELPVIVPPTSDDAELAGGFRVLEHAGQVTCFFGGGSGGSARSRPVDVSRRSVDVWSSAFPVSDPTRWVLGIVVGRDLGAVQVRIEGLASGEQPTVPLAELRPDWSVLGASFETALVTNGKLDIVALDSSGAEVGRTTATI